MEGSQDGLFSLLDGVKQQPQTRDDTETSSLCMGSSQIKASLQLGMKCKCGMMKIFSSKENRYLKCLLSIWELWGWFDVRVVHLGELAPLPVKDLWGCSGEFSRTHRFLLNFLFSPSQSSHIHMLRLLPPAGTNDIFTDLYEEKLIISLQEQNWVSFTKSTESY